MNSLGQHRSAELMRKGGVCQPVRIVPKEVADGRKSLPEQIISSPQMGVMGPPGGQSPTLGQKGWLQLKACCPRPKRGVSSPGFVKLGISPSENGVFAFPLPNVVVQTPDASFDALVRLGFQRAQMSSSARWSWKRRAFSAFSAIINCSAQEYEMPSTGVMGVGVVRPKVNASHLVKRAGFI